MDKKEVLKGLNIVLAYFNDVYSAEEDKDWREFMEYYIIQVENAIEYIDGD